MVASQIFSSDLAGDNAAKNRVLNDVSAHAAEHQARLAENGGEGVALSKQMPTNDNGDNGGDVYAA